MNRANIDFIELLSPNVLADKARTKIYESVGEGGFLVTDYGTELTKFKDELGNIFECDVTIFRLGITGSLIATTYADFYRQLFNNSIGIIERKI
jgi:hypothetical protein